MVRALQDTVVLGVTTNISYLLDILAHPAFLAGDVSTRFLDEHLTPWQPEPDLSNSTWLAIAAFERCRLKALPPVPLFPATARRPSPTRGRAPSGGGM